MKTTLLTLLLALAPCCAQAQEIFYFVLENAKRIVESPNENFTITRIAQFKYTALTYLRFQAFETQDEVTDEFLNNQAYHLSEFISLFFTEVLESQDKGEKATKKITKIFIDASISNPLYTDIDNEPALAYMQEPGELTPFSLNTDWEKAYNEAKEKLEKRK